MLVNIIIILSIHSFCLDLGYLIVYLFAQTKQQ